MNFPIRIGLIGFSLLLVSCAPSGRYSDRHDSAPIRPPSSLELQDAVISHEPLSGGNKPYQVFGKHYTPMRERRAFSQTGTASWYGKKFHGHLTSNGETYDMYGMSAAHKTLPLPSYVRVTNLANNKSVVVRVNDRGPFHQNRIIDLSYSAAYKIGVYDTGTAKVKVEVILPGSEAVDSILENTEVTAASDASAQTLKKVASRFSVAVSGFDSQEEAKESKKGLTIMLNEEAKHRTRAQRHQVVFGPFDSKAKAESLLQKVKAFGFSSAKLEVAE